MKKITALLLLTSSLLFSQNKEIDSLDQMLKTANNPFEKASINLQLAKLYERVDLSKGKAYALKSLAYKASDSLLAESNNQLGRFYFFAAQLDSAAFHFEETKVILKKIRERCAGSGCKYQFRSDSIAARRL